jgi:hypothetical protein
VTNVPAARRVAAVSLLLPAAIVGSTLSLGLRWSVGSDQTGYQLGIRTFLVAAIVLLGFALYFRESAPRRTESLVFLAAIALGTAVALAVRLFPAPGLVIAAASLALAVWCKRVLRAQRLAATLGVG